MKNKQENPPPHQRLRARNIAMVLVNLAIAGFAGYGTNDEINYFREMDAEIDFTFVTPLIITGVGSTISMFMIAFRRYRTASYFEGLAALGSVVLTGIGIWQIWFGRIYGLGNSYLLTIFFLIFSATLFWFGWLLRRADASE